MTASRVQYQTSDEVDFVIIGSGAAGGILAKELSTNGFRVVVLEQGPYLHESDFSHDELKILQEDLLTNHPKLQPNTFRKTPNEKAKPQRALVYGRAVGGTSNHFTANFWRFHEIDFIERSKVGPIPGATFSDWPIAYADLEPYYTKVEWEVGVSGLAGASPFDPPRSKPYPMPPLPVKSNGVLFERAARKLGLNPFPAPMAILSQPRAGRSACINCGFCLGFGCEPRIHDSDRGENRPLRNSPQQLRSQNRAGCSWPRCRGRLFRRKKERPLAKSESGHRLRQWRGNAPLALVVYFKKISQRPRQLQRLRRQESHAQLRRNFARPL